MIPSPTSALDLDVAARVLARAFQEDPGAVYFFEDPMQRAAMLPPLFQVMLRYGLKHGHVQTSGDPVRGVAIWLPPGQSTPDDKGMGEAGIGDVAAQWGEEEMSRLGTLVAYLEVLHGQLVQEPHWRLFFLGVEPEHQGEGIGSSLLQARPSSPSDLTPTYLETLTLSNARFYERHGYRVLAEKDMPRSGIHVWSMLRR